MVEQKQPRISHNFKKIILGGCSLMDLSMSYFSHRVHAWYHVPCGFQLRRKIISKSKNPVLKALLKLSRVTEDFISIAD